MISIRSRHSRRALPTQRSAIAFARGARTGVLMIRMPAAASTVSNAAAKALIPDQKLHAVGRSLESISRLRACLAIHSPVGWAVIPARRTRRMSCSMKNSAYRRRRDKVSTWRKSVARIVFAWACRNALHAPRTAGSAARVGPVPPDEVGAPAQQGAPRDEEAQLAELASGQQPGRHGQQQPRVPDLALDRGHLMAQDEDLSVPPGRRDPRRTSRR